VGAKSAKAPMPQISGPNLQENQITHFYWFKEHEHTQETGKNHIYVLVKPLPVSQIKFSAYSTENWLSCLEINKAL
jgi:hypothetical protein